MAESHVMRRNEAVATDIMSVRSAAASQPLTQPTFDTAVGDYDIVDALMNTGGSSTIFQQVNDSAGMNFSVDHIDTAQMQVDGSQQLNGAEAKAEMRNNGIAECQEKIAQMTKQWNVVQAQSQECMKEAISKQYHVSKADAGAIMQATFPSTRDSGMGSEVTAVANSISPMVTLSEKDLKKGPEEVRGLIIEATRIASSGGPEKMKSGAVSGVSDMDKQEYLASKLNEDGMKQALSQDLGQQKEFQEVSGKLDELHNVEAEHKMASQIYDEKNVLDKAIAHAPAYDDIQQTLGAIERPAAFKAEEIILTSEMVSFSADIERSPNDGLAGIQFDPQTVSLMKSLEANSKEIETTYDASSPELKDMSHQLQGIASQALRV